MAELSWIKLSTGLPDNKKIKRIRRLPDGDKVILIWVFILARAGESNQRGGLFLTETLPYTKEDLASDFDFTIEMVTFALTALEQYGMITLFEDIIFIKNWEEYQAVEGMEKVREQARLRQAKHREKQRQLSLCNVTDNVTSNAEVTPDNGTELELELELDKELKDIVELPIAEIVDYLNLKANTNYKSSSAATKSKISARFNEGFNLDDFKKVIDNKCDEWIENEEMAKFLRPETLFGTKFEGYLNQRNVKKDSNLRGNSEYDLF